MKKIALFLIMMCFFATPSFGECNYSGFCPKKAYDISSKKRQEFSRKIGATTLSEKIAQKRIKEDLRKLTNQNFNVAVKSYSFWDVYRGRFKSVSISGENLNLNGVYLTSLELKTLCDFNYVKLNKKPIQFKENMVIGFIVEISDDDLIKTIHTSGYLDKLNCVDVKGCGITFFKMDGADVEIKNNKLYFKVRITSHLFLPKPLDVVLATDLKAENGRIVFTKVNLGGLVQGVDLSKVASQLEKMNPLAFTLDVFENKNTKMCINSVDIVSNRIIIEGNVFIPKNTD